MKKFLIGVLMFAMSTSVYAQDVEGKTETGTPSQEMTSIGLGMQLAKYGYQNHSVTSLCEAARILASVKVQPLGVEKGVESSGKKADGKKTSNVVYEPLEILEDAKIWAGNDKTLLAMIDDVKEQCEVNQSRGAVGGPKHGSSRVEAYDTDVYNVSFYGGRYAEVIVDGDGDTDLDLYIYDSNGNLVDSDTDSTDYCVCGWTPKWTGSFKIKIKNRGGVYNRYTITTN